QRVRDLHLPSRQTLALASNARQWQPGVRALPAGGRGRRLSALLHGGAGDGGGADCPLGRVPGAVQPLILCPPAHLSTPGRRWVSPAVTSASNHGTFMVGGVALLRDRRGALLPIRTAVHR